VGLSDRPLEIRYFIGAAQLGLKGNRWHNRSVWRLSSTPHATSALNSPALALAGLPFCRRAVAEGRKRSYDPGPTCAAVSRLGSEIWRGAREYMVPTVTWAATQWVVWWWRCRVVSPLLASASR